MVAGALIDRLVHYATMVTGKISLQAISVTTTLAQLASSEPLGMLSAASSNADVRRSLTERSVASD
jgi:hypothetical protein